MHLLTPKDNTVDGYKNTHRYSFRDKTENPELLYISE